MSKVFSAIAAARAAAGHKDVALMGGGMLTPALEGIPAPGVTHLRYEVLR